MLGAHLLILRNRVSYRNLLATFSWLLGSLNPVTMRVLAWLPKSVTPTAESFSSNGYGGCYDHTSCTAAVGGRDGRAVPRQETQPREIGRASCRERG